MTTYKDLVVWQKSIKIVTEIYEITEQFPREEVFGITSQMRRSSISIPSNIAEGKMRNTQKEFVRFLCIARGSAAELETQITIAKNLSKTKHLDYSKVNVLL